MCTDSVELDTVSSKSLEDDLWVVRLLTTGPQVSALDMVHLGFDQAITRIGRADAGFDIMSPSMHGTVMGTKPVHVHGVRACVHGRFLLFRPMLGIFILQPGVVPVLH